VGRGKVKTLAERDMGSMVKRKENIRIKDENIYR